MDKRYMSYIAENIVKSLWENIPFKFLPFLQAIQVLPFSETEQNSYFPIKHI